MAANGSTSFAIARPMHGLLSNFGWPQCQFLRVSFLFIQYFLVFLLQAAANQPKTGYRLPSLSTENVLSSSAPSSNSNSITSTNHLHFWKAGSQSPITSPSCATPTTRQSQQHVNHILMVAWKFVKWPLALLLAATIIGALVYFLLLENELMTSGSHTKHHDTEQHRQHLSAGTSTTFGDDDELQQQERTTINFLNRYNGINRKKIQSSSASTVAPSLASNGIDPSAPITTVRSVSNDYVTKFDATASTAAAGMTTTTTITTTKPPSKYSKSIVYTSSEETRRRKLPKSPPHTTIILNTKDITDENHVDRTKLLFPTKETLEIFGFTSGHQNNFGVPIEEDERILRMLNEEMLSSQRKANKGKSDVFIVSTTDLNMYQTKVSPTLPILRKGDATTTERIRAPNTTDDGKLHLELATFSSWERFSSWTFLSAGTCQSTSLPLCRGILPYDLTNMKTSKSLTPQDLEHFQYLIESKCSIRSHEFVCAILEPECRPERMGPFMPCKRICKCMTNLNISNSVEFRSCNWFSNLFYLFFSSSYCRRFAWQQFWRLAHTLWHRLKCWRPHSTVTSIPIQATKTNAKIRPEALRAIQMNFNAAIKRAFHRNGGTINCSQSTIESFAVDFCFLFAFCT